MAEETIKCNSCGTSYNKMFLLGKQGNADTCPMCGGKLCAEDEHSDWITWYYYKDPEYGDYSLWDKLPLHPEKFELVKEFKAPPRDPTGSSHEAKKILRTYIPDAFSEPANPRICCPFCGSDQITILNQGYSLLTGFWGSGNPRRVCNRCMQEF